MDHHYNTESRVLTFTVFSNVNNVARYYPAGADTGTFRDNQVNNIAADTQAREFYLVNDT